MRHCITSLGLVLAAIVALGCGATVSQGADGRLRVELEGNRIVIGERIQFAHDSADILEASYPILDRVAALLDEHDEIVRVQVQGHTSTDGDETHNMELSTARAASVASYLREHGTTQEVTSQGYGETYPLCTEDSDACHEQNRRVEFFVDLR